MTRRQLIDFYGSEGEKIPLTYSPDYQTNDKNRDVDRAEIYEIWDKRSGKQIFIATTFDEVLEDFLMCEVGKMVNDNGKIVIRIGAYLIFGKNTAPVPGITS